MRWYPSAWQQLVIPAWLAICQEQRELTCRGPLSSPWCRVWSPFQNRFFGAGWNNAGTDFVFMIRNHSEGIFELKKGLVEELYNPPKSIILLMVITVIVVTIYLIPTMRQAFSYFIFFVLTTMTWCGYYYPDFIDESTESQRLSNSTKYLWLANGKVSCHTLMSPTPVFFLLYCILMPDFCLTHLPRFSRMFSCFRFL